MAKELSTPATGTSLLAAAAARRRERDEAERLAVGKRLRSCLCSISGLGAVWVYGSLVKPGRFTRDSDVDVAIEQLPEGTSLYLLQSLLSEATGREVDVCLLHETRLRRQIETQGQRWT